ncbi:hypothetical protein ACO0QE_002556 [Hanseniaspora vineae]
MVTTESLSHYFLDNLLHNLAQQVVSETVCDYQQNKSAFKQFHASHDLFSENSTAQNTAKDSSPAPDTSAKKIPSSFIPSTSQTLAGLNNKELLSYLENQENNTKATGGGNSNGNAANSNGNLAGAVAMALSDTLDHSASATPGPTNIGLSITSAAVNTLKDEVVYLTCENCKRTIATNRFAQHLERCLSSRTRK